MGGALAAPRGGGARATLLPSKLNVKRCVCDIFHHLQDLIFPLRGRRGEAGRRCPRPSRLRSPRSQAFCGTGSSQALFLPVFWFGHPERGAAAHRTLAVLLRASRRLSETDFDAQRSELEPQLTTTHPDGTNNGLHIRPSSGPHHALRLPPPMSGSRRRFPLRARAAPRDGPARWLGEVPSGNPRRCGRGRMRPAPCAMPRQVCGEGRGTPVTGIGSA